MRQLTLIVFVVFAIKGVYLDGDSDDEQQVEFLKQVDELLERDTLDGVMEAQRLLLEQNEVKGDNPSLLWRLAKCQFEYQSFIEHSPKKEKQAWIEKGLKYAEDAVRLNASDPDAHKWVGILVGLRGQSMGLLEKARAGIMYKKHLDKVIELRPDDSLAHHLIGVFQFEIGKMSRFERRLAQAVFSDIPYVTVGDAVQSLLLANEYSKKPWKMNCVYLVKCYLHEKKISDAKSWLQVADDIEVKTREDEKAAKEIFQLRKQLR